MEPGKKSLIEDILCDSAILSEEEFLSAMLRAVKRRKIYKLVTSTALSIAAFSGIAALWQFLIFDQSNGFNHIETEQGLTSIIETYSNVEILYTSSEYFSYVEDQPIIIRGIDDNELDSIFSNQAYAILDNRGAGKMFFALTALEDDFSF